MFYGHFLLFFFLSIIYTGWQRNRDLERWVVGIESTFLLASLPAFFFCLSCFVCEDCFYHSVFFLVLERLVCACRLCVGTSSR
jgi:hypothetical protein